MGNIILAVQDGEVVNVVLSTKEMVDNNQKLIDMLCDDYDLKGEAIWN